MLNISEKSKKRQEGLKEAKKFVTSFNFFSDNQEVLSLNISTLMEERKNTNHIELSSLYMKRLTDKSLQFRLSNIVKRLQAQKYTSKAIYFYEDISINTFKRLFYIFADVNKVLKLRSHFKKLAELSEIISVNIDVDCDSIYDINYAISVLERVSNPLTAEKINLLLLSNLFENLNLKDSKFILSMFKNMYLSPRFNWIFYGISKDIHLNYLKKEKLFYYAKRYKHLHEDSSFFKLEFSKTCFLHSSDKTKKYKKIELETRSFELDSLKTDKPISKNLPVF